VDDHLRTTNSRIFAAGDVCFPYKFTHTADFLARIVIRNALFPLGRARASNLNIPWVTYTEPEIAHVGLDEAAAQKRGWEVDTFLQPFSGVDRAVLDGETEGFVKIHVKRGSDRILGATIVGAHAGEMISEVSVAMQGGVGLGALANVIHPYPTTADAIRKCGDLYNKTRLKPWVKKLFQWLLG
jgi:pyruvate/2-oxoglutarate dehydrogenase complex dihydrolipoamide dehydrogenase (E3) component